MICFGDQDSVDREWQERELCACAPLIKMNVMWMVRKYYLVFFISDSKVKKDCRKFEKYRGVERKHSTVNTVLSHTCRTCCFINLLFKSI